jgi:hypothetical protein
MMMPFSRRLACLLAAMTGFSVAHAAEVVIDDFTTAQSASGSVDGAGILGGERDATVIGSNQLNISGGLAMMSLPLLQSGAFIILQYDGNDGGSQTSYDLGDVDLTDGGNNDRIVLNVTALSGSVQGLVYIAEGESEFAVVDFDIDHAGLYQLPFQSLTISDPPMVFTSINRIDLRIIMDPGESITLNQFSASSGPLLFEDGFESE